MPPGSQRRRTGAGAVLLTLIALAAIAAAPAWADVEPQFEFLPQSTDAGSVDGPCGLAVDVNGAFYLSGHYNRKVYVFTGARGYLTQLSDSGSLGGPCGLAVDGVGNLYVNEYHGGVTRYTPSSFPLTTISTYGSPTVIDTDSSTGVATALVGSHVFVNNRTHVTEYDAAGSPVGTIGNFEDGYGVAVSSAGDVYVPDAATNTVKVYDSSGTALTPIAGPPGGFASLRDSAIAVDRVSGVVYVADNTQLDRAEQPRARVQVFSSAGVYLGHLKYDVVDGAPTGIAVDNSSEATQGRVYVTSGNAGGGGVYIYTPGAQTPDPPEAPTIPLAPAGGVSLFPTVPIGAAAGAGSGIACEGDACQVLPPQPVDPTLTTRLQGLGNPRARYRRYARNCGPLARDARTLSRRARGARRGARRAGGSSLRLRSRATRLAKRARRAKRAAKRCRRANRRLGAGASASATGIPAVAASVPAPTSPAPAGERAGPGAFDFSATGPSALALLPGAAGFDAAVWADGEAATAAGSHPYSLEFDVGLDQSEGPSDLRNLRIDLPSGLLANPAMTSLFCTATLFSTPRDSPFESSQSGENCPQRTQTGTVEVTSSTDGTRRFGLFELDPADGTAFRLGASPFGRPLILDAQIRSEGGGTYLSLAASEVPQDLQLQALKLTLWGAPWDASHDGERGNCLNEAEPGFPWAKCPVGSSPLAFLTLPTECGPPLSFSAAVASWQQSGSESASAVNRDSGGDPAPIADCASLGFDPDSDGQLSVHKASSSSGFVFNYADDDSARLANPRARIRSLPRKAVVELPRGVTLNPSLGAGLETCSPAQLAGETAFNPPGAGCPNGSKIGEFRVRLPFYEGLLDGGIYLAKPDRPDGSPGAENPFDTLLAVYLIVKSADRGILISVPGKLVPDPGDGTLTATFDDLPQLPYTDLEVNFRSGQRAPLVSPPSCGAATTEITLTPWAVGAPTDTSSTDSSIDSGIDFGPCPDGSTPPFDPGAIAGGVNSNVGSYTPYFIHLSRKDTEQEITSYSLVLPKGITGKIAGIPFCPDAAIEAARHRQGADETANPSCPAASQVGRTDTGYGVGPALTYAPGRIYLAGPYGGSPLSLVTINAATVGPFDLGTIVIRSAFDIDERTAQLQIDSAASDPIPHIIDGVPLHLRDIRIHMDRFQFTHNPSSCEPSQLISTLTGSGASFATPADDSTATVSRHFQLLNCLTLGFRPRLGLRLRGTARRGGYPSLRASFVSRGDRDSNLKRIEVEMPHSLFLVQNHIRSVCTREQFAAQRCPRGSVYGRAVAETLLFDEPLRGNVYLRSSSNKLPDLVADLRSGAIRIVVEGRIGPGRHGGINTFFDNLPDAPIDRFTMTLFGGRRGLLQNSSNICKTPPLATISALGQNNIGARFSSELRGQCKKRAKGKKKAKRTGHTRRRGGRR